MLKHGRIDPVLKDRQWSAYIDRSPGAAGYSEECFHACVAGCGYKFEIPSQKVDTIHPNRPVKPPPVKKPPPPPFDSSKTTVDSSTTTEDILILELIVIRTTSFQHQDFPEDPSGRFDDFDHFVNSNFDTCKWIGWLLVLAQGCSVLLAAVLRATEKDQGRKYGNEDDNAPQRLPFLGYPVQPFPCAIVDFPLALQQ
ncbi:hypothetical protein RHGRI_037579 [Rhododendron griersonianum]|uniref:Uncharacterized protein n=1 Tax=Rhododendron griersonianum TaxID=479676 RepID=A0AAV6HWJ4_9ERIC|nr:hypothetical protein RHGRI_037579 [Rhododendron griersonianum]